MKKSTRLIFGLLLGAILFWVALPFVLEDETTEGIVLRLYSNVLHQDREVYVHLPAAYDSSRAYPTFYVLDGGSLDQAVRNTLDTLINTPEAIVVGIPNMSSENRELDLIPPFMKTDYEEASSPFGRGDRFLDFVEKELIPFVEKKFASNKDRVFVGNSRGGLLVIYSLLHNLELFQSRFAFSAPVWRGDSILVQKLYTFLASYDSIENFLYMSVGENETERMKEGVNKMKECLIKRRSHTCWKVDITKNADHSTNAITSMPDALEFWMNRRKR